MHNIPSPAADTDQTIEQEIKARGLNAPRVTPEQVEAAVVAEQFYVFPGTMLTICCLTLRNGFTVTGESACASAENFRTDIGERIARANAVQKIWPLLGYTLLEQLSASKAPPPRNLEDIARVCHEVNRAYCQAHDDMSQPNWEGAPQWQKDSALAGVKLHVTNPFAGPQASHESWMAEKTVQGWKYGAYKDPENKLHPCMVPFDDLPVAQQAKDYIFRGVVHALMPF